MNRILDKTGEEDPTITSSVSSLRALLDRLAPLEGLSQAGRAFARRTLRAALAEPLEETGRLTLARLGAEWRSPPPAPPFHDAPITEPWPRGTVPPPSPPMESRPAVPSAEGLLRYPRALLPAQARGGLDRAHRLLRLDDPYLSSDPRRPDARLGLIEQIHHAGRDVLGASDLQFVPATGGDGLDAGAVVDPVLARQALGDPDLLHYCPDTSIVPGPGLRRRRREIQALVAVAVTSSTGQTLGLLEVSSAKKDPFRIDDLALIALLADYCAGVLDRAAKIEKLVFIDPMTAAYNRSYFQLEVQSEMARARRESSSMALCIADIDDFKSFNSSFGYEGGNQVLVHVAQSLKGAVRPFDTVARWGGEEFAVLLTAPVQAQDVVTVSERLRSMVERQEVSIQDLEGRPRQVGVTVSIGVALFPDDDTSAEGLWRAANQALLEAKRPPKNRVVFYGTLKERPGPDTP